MIRLAVVAFCALAWQLNQRRRRNRRQGSGNPPPTSAQPSAQAQDTSSSSVLSSRPPLSEPPSVKLSSVNTCGSTSSTSTTSSVDASSFSTQAPSSAKHSPSTSSTPTSTSPAETSACGESSCGNAEPKPTLQVQPSRPGVSQNVVQSSQPRTPKPLTDHPLYKRRTRMNLDELAIFHDELFSLGSLKPTSQEDAILLQEYWDGIKEYMRDCVVGHVTYWLATTPREAITEPPCNHDTVWLPPGLEEMEVPDDYLDG